MKRASLFVTAFMLLFTLIAGCTPANLPDTTESPQAVQSPEPTDKAEIQYTDEFDYLPRHPAMSLKELQEGEKAGQDYAFYLVSGVAFDDFLKEYEEILIQDGWTVTNDDKPTGLGVKKDEHIAAMTFSKTEEGQMLAVTSF